jgi:hypothetical protein
MALNLKESPESIAHLSHPQILDFPQPAWLLVPKGVFLANSRYA